MLADLREAVGDDPVFIDQLVDTYLAEAPGFLVAIDRPSRRGARPCLVIPAHTLKGNSTTIGAMHLAELARSLEERGRRGQMAGRTTTPRPAGRRSSIAVRRRRSMPHAPPGGPGERAGRAAAGGEGPAMAARVLDACSSSTTATSTGQTLARLLGSLGHESWRPGRPMRARRSSGADGAGSTSCSSTS